MSPRRPKNESIMCGRTDGRSDALIESPHHDQKSLGRWSHEFKELERAIPLWKWPQGRQRLWQQRHTQAAMIPSRIRSPPPCVFDYGVVQESNWSAIWGYIQYVLSKAGVMEESVNRELNITRSWNFIQILYSSFSMIYKPNEFQANLHILWLQSSAAWKPLVFRL